LGLEQVYYRGMVTVTQVDVAQGRAAVSAAATWLVGLRESMFAVGNAELGPFFRQVDDLSRQVEAAQVAILSEALSRGVVAGSECPTATAWVIDWAPSFRAGGAAQLVRVTQATLGVRNAGLAAAVLGARVGVRNAAAVLVVMDKLRPRLRDEALEAVWEGFIQIATDHGPTEIRGLRDKLIATYGQQEEFQRRHDQLKHGVSLSQPLDDDGMAEYRLRLDPEGKEVLEAMLGPLYPQPEGGSLGASGHPAPQPAGTGAHADVPATRGRVTGRVWPRNVRERLDVHLGFSRGAHRAGAVTMTSGTHAWEPASRSQEHAP